MIHRRHKIAAATALTVALLAPNVGPASAAENPISGSTASSSCTWFTSANVRYTSVAAKTVRVKLSSVGKLGVKMRTKNENTGSTSVIGYYPPLDTYQNMGYFATKSSPFRFQFTCVNSKNWWESSPDTSFYGTADY